MQQVKEKCGSNNDVRECRKAWKRALVPRVRSSRRLCASVLAVSNPHLYS